MANRINHASAKIPAPCPALFVRMGAAGYKHSMEVSGRTDCTPFANLPSDVQDTWKGIARSMYAVIAIDGGATVGIIPEPKDA